MTRAAVHRTMLALAELDLELEEGYWAGVISARELNDICDDMSTAWRYWSKWIYASPALKESERINLLAILYQYTLSDIKNGAV